jgi:hypothetical protein
MISMNMKINLDVDQFFKELEEMANAAMEDLMMAAYDEWRDQAGRVLDTTRLVYREAIQHQLIRPGTVHLFLQSEDKTDNWLANALEIGYGKFNIWPAVLSGRGATQSRAAYYYSERGKKKGFKGGAPATPFVDIPFRPGVRLQPGMSRRKIQATPDEYRRMSRGNVQGKWIHPGFPSPNKPHLGSGAMIEHVVQYVKETAQDIFDGKLNKVTV